MGRLTQVQMTRDAVPQTRTWTYDAVTERLASAYMPETGTVSYTYNGDGTLQSKTDAKGQRIDYTYDDKQRVTAITPLGRTCEQVRLSYDTNTIDPTYSQYGSGRLTVEEWGNSYSCASGLFRQMYSYTKPGLTTGKRLLMDRYHEEQENVYRIADLRITRTYDNEGRVATQSGAGGNYSYGYNSMGRPNRLTQTVTPAYDIISAAQYGPGR
jgi:YD repeat-containing protein